MASSSPNQKCRLCLRDDVTLRQSHVLSEFLYKGVYEYKGKHSRSAIGIDPRADRPDRVIQKGLREALLCDSCENHLSKWENYAAKILSKLPPTDSRHPGDIVWLRGLNYEQFKLFQISLLWRCSVAEGPTFAAVDLGPHQETIRQMLLTANPGKPWEYGCILTTPRSPGSLEGIVKFPGKFRIDGHNAYHLVARGLIWFYVVSRHAERLT